MKRIAYLLVAAISLSGFAFAEADEAYQQTPKQMTEEEHQRFLEQMDAEREAAGKFQQLVDEGREQAQAGNKEQAISSYRSAIEADPRHRLALYYETRISQLNGLGDAHSQHLRNMLTNYRQEDCYSSANSTSFSDSCVILPYYCCYSLGLGEIERGRVQEGRQFLLLGLDYLQMNHARRLEEWLGPPRNNEDLQPERREAAQKFHAERQKRAETGSLWDMDCYLVDHLVSGKPFGTLYMDPKYQTKVEPLLTAMIVAHYTMSFPEDQRFTELSRLHPRFPKASPIATAIGYAMDYCRSNAK